MEWETEVTIIAGDELGNDWSIKKYNDDLTLNLNGISLDIETLREVLAKIDELQGKPAEPEQGRGELRALALKAKDAFDYQILSVNVTAQIYNKSRDAMGHGITECLALMSADDEPELTAAIYKAIIEAFTMDGDK